MPVVYEGAVTKVSKSGNPKVNTFPSLAHILYGMAYISAGYLLREILKSTLSTLLLTIDRYVNKKGALRLPTVF